MSVIDDAFKQFAQLANSLVQITNQILDIDTDDRNALQQAKADRDAALLKLQSLNVTGADDDATAETIQQATTSLGSSVIALSNKVAALNPPTSSEVAAITISTAPTVNQVEAAMAAPLVT